MSEWISEGEDWTPQLEYDEAYDPTWPYNWKWGVSADNQVAVWRAKGGVDGRPTHRAELTKLWGREIKVGQGDILGLATYKPAERKLDGTLVAPPIIRLQTYYNVPTPKAIYQWFESNFPGVQIVEGAIVRPRLGKVAEVANENFNTWAFDDRDDYTGRTVKWIINEAEDPPLLMWEVKGQDGSPVHNSVIEDYWGRWREPDDYMGYGDIYESGMEISGYTRIPAALLSRVTELARKTYPDMDITTDRAILEVDEPQFGDAGNIKAISRSGLWAANNLKIPSSVPVEGSESLSKGWEVVAKVSAWGETEEGEDRSMSLGRELVIQDGDQAYPIDEYEAMLLLSEGYITPMMDYEVDEDGYPVQIEGVYELTARMWDDMGMQGRYAFDYFDDMLGRNKDSNDQERFPKPDISYFSPKTDPLIQSGRDPYLENLYFGKTAGADLDGAMIGLFVDPPTAKKLKQPGGEPEEQMHITLIYFQDKAEDRDDWDEVERITEQFANQYAALEGSINGFGVFYNDEDVVFAIPSVNGLAELRSELLEAVEDAGFPVNQEHDWVPHITLKYGTNKLPELDEPLQLKFRALTFAKGEDKQSFAFQGALEKVGAWGDEETSQFEVGQEVTWATERSNPGLGMGGWKKTPSRGTILKLYTDIYDQPSAVVRWLMDEGSQPRTHDTAHNLNELAPVHYIDQMRLGGMTYDQLMNEPIVLDREAGQRFLEIMEGSRTPIVEPAIRLGAWGEPEEHSVSLQDQRATEELLGKAMEMWKTTDPFHPKVQGDLQRLLHIMYENEPEKVEELMDWFLDSYRIEHDQMVDSKGWIRYEPKERGSRFGFVMLAADISELASKARETLMNREDIATMGQQYLLPQVVDPSVQQTEQDLETNPKHNPQMHQQISRVLNYLPDELYKFYPWAVNQHKKGTLPYNQMQHVRDILTQFRNHQEYLRTTPRNAPTWEQTPDINQMTFPDAEGWVYARNARGIDPRPQITWEVENKAMEWDDGWYVTPVTTDKDLAQEGEVMGHCVGGYCGQVNSGETTIWSLRDPKGESHVTFEMQPQNRGDNIYRVIQVQGKSDQTPKPEYQARVAEFFDKKKQEGWNISGSTVIESVWELEEWYQNLDMNGDNLGEYGLDSDIDFDYGNVAREIVDDAISYNNEPEYETIRAYEAAADKMRGENARQAMYELESRAEDAVESKKDEMESDLESIVRDVEREYWQYVEDMKRDAEQLYDDQRYEEQGDEDEEDDEDEFDPDSVEVPDFDEWFYENYGQDDYYWRAIAWKAGDLDLEEEALNEMGWSRWW